MARRAWDQRDDEPSKAFALFLIYRAMGVERSVRKMAKEHGYSYPKLNAISNRFSWSFRADQYDAWSLSARSHAAERRVLREAELEAKTVNALVKMSAVLARRALKQVMSDKELSLTPQGAAQVSDIVVKLSRLARGEATNRSEHVAKAARQRVSEKIERVAKILDRKLREASGGDGDSAT